jgi:hypothetical protein
MATNIVSLIMQAITPEILDRVSAAIGIDRATLQKAVSAGVPGILAALTSMLAKPGGAAKIESVTERQSASMVDNLSRTLGTPQQAAAVDQGLGSLSSILGGGVTNALAGALNKYAGLGDAGAKGLLGLLAPVVMRVLGQQAAAAPGGVAQLLEQQEDNIARALPSGFASYLKGSGVLAGMPDTGATLAARARSAPGAGNNWVWPVLGALVLLGIGWYLLGRGGHETTTADNTPVTQTEGQMRTSGSGAFTVAEQDIGKWIHKPVYSSDNRQIGEIVELNRGPDDKVTDFYLDSGTFLGMGSQRYHITADEIREVKPDGLVLTLSEADVKAMPSTPANQPVQPQGTQPATP